jgi:hypothetical protein
VKVDFRQDVWPTPGAFYLTALEGLDRRVGMIHIRKMGILSGLTNDSSTGRRLRQGCGRASDRRTGNIRRTQKRSSQHLNISRPDHHQHAEAKSAAQVADLAPERAQPRARRREKVEMSPLDYLPSDIFTDGRIVTVGGQLTTDVLERRRHIGQRRLIEVENRAHVSAVIGKLVGLAVAPLRSRDSTPIRGSLFATKEVGRVHGRHLDDGRTANRLPRH